MLEELLKEIQRLAAMRWAPSNSLHIELSQLALRLEESIKSNSSTLVSSSSVQPIVKKIQATPKITLTIPRADQGRVPTKTVNSNKSIEVEPMNYTPSVSTRISSSKTTEKVKGNVSIHGGKV